VKVVLFTGPTLSPRDASEVIDAVCLPPAAQGDVYRAALDRPFAIGLIDGYFDSVPAVWHKEILWALREGIHVFGSASMGALRAAELSPFGMVGVGAIFETFRDGILEDDDEVAVAHGPAEHGYRVCSDAMVNIRATLAQARIEGILDPGTSATLERIAKDLFYAERSWARILEIAAARGVSAGALDAFRRWHPGGAVNQKREDALAMLAAIRELVRSDPAPKTVDWHLEETLFWQELKRAAAEVPSAAARAEDQLVLAALREDPLAASRAEAAALGWWMAAEAAHRAGHLPDAALLLEEAAEFCAQHSLASSADLDRWLERNRCSREQLDRLLAAHALYKRAQTAAPAALEASLLEYLRWTGEYARLLAARRSTDDDLRAAGDLQSFHQIGEAGS
jgi:hypothetical protein